MSLFENDVILSSNWSIYSTSINTHPAFIALDLEACELKSNANNTYIISFTCKNSKQSFFIDESITDNLEKKIIDELIDDNLDLSLVGTIRMEYNYELIFVTTSEDIDEVKLFKKFEDIDYNITGILYLEDDWAYYVNVLYPSMHELARMNNLVICESILALSGDLTSSRSIEYVLYFNTELDFEKYLEILDNSYSLVSKTVQDNNIKVVIKNFTSPNYDNMNDISDYLCELFYHLDGYLEGWNITLDN